MALALTGLIGAALLLSETGSMIAVHVEGDLPRSWALGVAALFFAILIAGLVELRRMLDRIVNGEAVFGLEAIRHYRRFARFMLIASVVAIILPSLLSVVEAMSAGQGEVRLALAAPEIIFLFLSGVLYFVALLLEEAATFEHDSRSIV